MRIGKGRGPRPDRGAETTPWALDPPHVSSSTLEGRDEEGRERTGVRSERSGRIQGSGLTYTPDIN